MPGWGMIALATISGACMALAVVAAGWATKAELRARLAEDLLARGAARRSDAVARGNRTRAEQARNRVLQKTREMREAIAAQDARQQGLGLD